MELHFDAVLKLDDLQAILARRGLAPGGAVQKYVDSEVIRYCDPKVPFRTGMLKDSALTASVVGEGLIVYAMPYAAKLYRSPQYRFNGAPERGAYWFERAMAEHKDDIVAGAAALAGGTAK